MGSELVALMKGRYFLKTGRECVFPPSGLFAFGFISVSQNSQAPAPTPELNATQK